MNVLILWLVLLLCQDILIASRFQLLIIFLPFVPSYLIIGNFFGGSNLSGNNLRTVKPYTSPWSDPYRKNVRWEAALTRLRIGHTNLTHPHLMTRSPPTLCPSCHIPFSVSHILLFCPRYAADRAATFPCLSYLPRQPGLHDILTESPHFSLDRIISFLPRTHILHWIWSFCYSLQFPFLYYRTIFPCITVSFSLYFTAHSYFTIVSYDLWCLALDSH